MVKIKPHPATSGNASADRLLTLLTAFRIGDKSLTLAELAERTELNKATIMRLIVSLEDFGFVNRLSDGRYTLASEVMRLNTIYPLYTTNFTEPLSYQGSAFLKLPKFP
ncbi:helix-turn-helix domain-containing protein, partial [Acinetobacter baumannii]|uniref:helix-turn-helix domain-containing protein n=1 Tax=Acinetobacter baumannii TaxID=470 RepID=UPI001D0E2C08